MKASTVSRSLPYSVVLFFACAPASSGPGPGSSTGGDSGGPTGGSATGGRTGTGGAGAAPPATGGLMFTGGAGMGGGAVTGGAPAGTGGAGTGGATTSPDAATATDSTVRGDTSSGGSDASGGIDIAGKLHRYLRSLRCMRLNTDPRSCFAFPEDEVKRESLSFGGDATVTYDVVLRIRGIIEPRGYTGGALQDTMNPWLYVGGMPGGPGDNAAYNVYRIAVSSPAQVYYLNRNHNGYLNSARDHDLHKIDYKAVLKVKGGATVDVINEDRRGSGMNNNHMKLIVEGVPPEILMQGANGFNGQFFYIEVESVTPTN